MEEIWVIKLVLAHLCGDFLFQPKEWVLQKARFGFRSFKLYLHAGVVSTLSMILIGPKYWPVILIIFCTHLLIDGWKSYRPGTAKYFLIDQLLHLIVILICWYYTFESIESLRNMAMSFNESTSGWLLLSGYIFLTWPVSVLIGQLTKRWRTGLDNSEALANAGKWIGILERLLILTFILADHFDAVGFLIAAKGLIRFSEKDRPEQKTEYLLIGTLISVGLSIITGMTVVYLRLPG